LLSQGDFLLLLNKICCSSFYLCLCQAVETLINVEKLLSSIVLRELGLVPSLLGLDILLSQDILKLVVNLMVIAKSLNFGENFDSVFCRVVFKVRLNRTPALIQVLLNQKFTRCLVHFQINYAI
jgi:hypothetical protein